MSTTTPIPSPVIGPVRLSRIVTCLIRFIGIWALRREDLVCIEIVSLAIFASRFFGCFMYRPSYSLPSSSNILSAVPYLISACQPSIMIGGSGFSLAYPIPSPIMAQLSKMKKVDAIARKVISWNLIVRSNFLMGKFSSNYILFSVELDYFIYIYGQSEFSGSTSKVLVSLLKPPPFSENAITTQCQFFPYFGTM